MNFMDQWQTLKRVDPGTVHCPAYIVHANYHNLTYTQNFWNVSQLLGNGLEYVALAD